MLGWFDKKRKRPLIERSVSTVADALELITEASIQNAELSRATWQELIQLASQLQFADLDHANYANQLNEMLMSSQAAYGVYLLKESTLLNPLLPELAANAGVKQGGLHHLDVLDHSLEALRQLLIHYPTAKLTLRWGTLLHDVGKALTYETGDFGRPSFYGHHQVGDEQSRVLLERFAMPKSLTDTTCQLVHYHMVGLPKNKKEAKRFVQRRHELLPDLLYLMLADREAARGRQANAASRVNYKLGIARVIEALEAETEPLLKPLLNGKEIATLLKLEPGPRIGEAIRFLQASQEAGDFKTKEEAKLALLHFAKRQVWMDGCAN